MVRGGEDRGKVILVAGPTASGKSALAAHLARKFEATVVNADSMQVYAGPAILTAQPDAALQALAPHRLYGVADPAEPCSAGRWRDLAKAEIAAIAAAGRPAVVVGGSGLYLRTLQHGISPIPEIPGPIRAEARALFAALGNDRFHRLLAGKDAAMAARLAPGNSQRLVRAWEVLAATGRSLADWQAEPLQGGLDADILAILVLPEVGPLRASIDGRFLAMVEAGALEEAAAMKARGLDPALPAMKALGLPELLAHLDGSLPLARAIEAAQGATWHYARRQRTWFRHQFDPQLRIGEQFSERLLPEIFSKIRQFLLTRRD